MESDYSGYFSPKNIAGLLVGSLLLAVGVNAFIAPHNLAFGGVTGLAIIVKSLTGQPLPLANAVMSGVIALVGWRVLGFKFFVKTVIPTAMTTFWLWATAGLGVFASNIVFAIPLGALTMGAGIGIVVGVGGSTAGTDTVALFLNKAAKMPVKPVMWAIDISVILCGLFVYGLKTAACSVIVALVMIETINRTAGFISKHAVVKP